MTTRILILQTNGEVLAPEWIDFERGGDDTLLSFRIPESGELTSLFASEVRSMHTITVGEKP